MQYIPVQQSSTVQEALLLCSTVQQQAVHQDCGGVWGVSGAYVAARHVLLTTGCKYSRACMAYAGL
jgi:hypothetical protein